MFARKFFLAMALLFAATSVPHLEDAIHAVVHAKGLAHTHDHADAIRTNAHFHEDGLNCETDGTPQSHHHAACLDEDPIATGSVNQNRAVKAFPSFAVTVFLNMPAPPCKTMET